MILLDPASKNISSSLIFEIQSKDLIVYGSGEDYRHFKSKVLDKHGVKPSLVVDRKMPGFEDVKFHQECVIVVCLGDPEERAKAKNWLMARSENPIYDSHQFYDHMLIIEPEGFSDVYFFQNEQKIRYARSLFQHEWQSVSIFENFIFSYVKRWGLPIICNDGPKNQYFDRSVPNLDCNFPYWVCAGAYDGKNIDEALNRFFTKRVLAFEPNWAMHIDLLKKYAYRPEIEVLPYALWSDNTNLDFILSGQGSQCSAAGRLSRSDGMVKAISLDNYPLPFTPTFISMDIEGSEIEAIKGMAHTIQRHSPALAVTVYHRPDHIWEIPLLLHSLNPEYDFYLRNYSGYNIETVLYAVPS